MTARVSAPALRSSAGPGFGIAVALLVAAGVVALRPLASFWNDNPDYFFGWGVPFLAAYLLAERWPNRPLREPELSRLAAIRTGIVLLPWAFLFLVTRLVIEIQPAWRPALWMLGGLYVGAVLVWLRAYGGRAWVRHFGFPVCFLLLAVPWIYNLELPIVQGLMRLNASLVASSLVLADIPAEARGNTIALATGQLGVNEACSGIRSLQASIMMSCFLGEFYRFPLGKRLALPAAALVFAMGGNYLRLLFLAVQGAENGIGSVDEAHDSAGWTVLIFTILALSLCCELLRRHEVVPIARKQAAGLSKPTLSASFPARNRLAFRIAAGFLVATLFGEGFTQAWYAWRENSAPRRSAWRIQWPLDARDFQPIVLPERTQDFLHADGVQAARWRDALGWRWETYWFAYRPRLATGAVFDSHNPGICLPAAGLREIQDEGGFAETVRGISLRAQGFLYTSGSARAYVFWIAYRNRGRVESGVREGIYDRTPLAFLERSVDWLGDAWDGCRRTDGQTLEVMIDGPDSYAAARRAYVAFLDRAVIPESDATARAGTP